MIQLHVEHFLEEMGQSKSVLTVKNYRSTIQKFINFTGIDDVAEVVIRDVVRFKNENLAKGTVASSNTQLKRLKVFFNWAIDRGLLLDNPADDIKLTAAADLPPKWLTESERDKLIRAVKRDSVGSHLTGKKRSYRNYAIVLMMLKTGIRLTELVELKWEDVKISERKGSILIRGKGGQQREIFIVTDLLATMKAYLEHDGMKGDYVFYSQQSNKVSQRTVQTMIEGYSDVVGTAVTAHMLRHTFAHDLIVGGLPLEGIARLMGHIKRDGTPNIQQTIRYTKASESELADGMEKILGMG